MRIAIAALGLFAVGCASTPPPPEPKPEPEVPAARVVWSVPIAFEAGVPVISAKVRDGSTKFAIATSSSNHTLTKQFAEAVRAPVSATRQQSQVHGAAAEVETVEGVVAINAANAEWRLEKVVALDTQALDPRGIGGLLVPQALATNTTTVVVDFKGGDLTLVEGEPELFAAWFESKFGTPDKVKMTRKSGALYIDAAVAGGAPIPVALDSASPKSRFLATSLGAEMKPDACVEGADLMQACLPGTPATAESLTFGAQTFGAWEAVAVAGDPAVGADILQKCVVAISVGNEAWVACD